jgi:hypothetical protein
MRKFLLVHFMFFGVLALIGLIPGGALMLMLITFPLLGIPGFIAIAAPTILLYSVALIPLWLALVPPRSQFWQIAAAMVLAIVATAGIAIGPGMRERHEATEFAQRMSKDDISRPATGQPKSIELKGDTTSGMLIYPEAIGDKFASCNETCQRLLFNGEVEWVRMTRVPDIYQGKRSGNTASVTYRIEHRVSCPQVFPENTAIEKGVRNRLNAGDCLIAEAGRNDRPDASVILTTRYSSEQYKPKLPDQAPERATIASVKDLRIDATQNGVLTLVLQQTETIVLAASQPFYIGSQVNFSSGYSGALIGRDKIVTKPIDLAQALRDKFGYKIAEIAAPPPEDAGKVAERILTLPPETNPTLSAEQQDGIHEVLAGLAKQPALSDADVDFIRRVLSDKRNTEAKLGIPMQQMFHRFSARLQPLIPIVLDRIDTPVREQAGHYKSALGWSLMNYPNDVLLPYRDRLVAIVEAQAEWPTNGVLTRLGELGGEEGLNLVIRRLDSKTVRQFAAIAACRASTEAWPTLEPAVLAHLVPAAQRNRLLDEDSPMLLALVRHGRRSLAAEMIESRNLPDKERVLGRLAKFEPGFGVERCRDRL